MIVRAARLDELPTLKAFEQSIIAAERPYNTSLAPDPISYYDLGELIASEAAEVAVIEIGGEIVASGYARKMKVGDYFKHTHICFLGFMYVRPEHRGKGLNKVMLDYLLAWSKAMGLSEIRLTVYAENEAAVRAYEKAGFFGHLTEMRLTLEDQTTS